MSSRVLKKGKNRITQGYHSKHLGVDLGREHITGEPVIAHSGGKVVFCQTGQKNNQGSTGNASYGNCVKIDHGDGWATLYAHLAAVKVKNGDIVKQGQVIGTMGNTGNSYGIHLHFEVRKGTSRINPEPYLNADLPLVKDEPIHVTYQVYTNKWLPEVVDCQDNDSNGYAGIRGVNMTAFKAKPDKGVLKYRVHLLGGMWLDWVTSEKSWAGIRGKKIDAIQMKLDGADGYDVQYRVSPTDNKKTWYGWCTGLKDATGDGYAGVFGKPIDCIQVKIITKD